MSEYVFRVNPEHGGASDGTAGWLEGAAPKHGGHTCRIDVKPIQATNAVPLRRSKASA